MTTELELQHLSELADARLDVAEGLCWLIFLLVVWVVQLKWETWLGGFAAAGIVYYVLTMSYRRAAAKAEDEYYRVAHLGKYSRAGGEDA